MATKYLQDEVSRMVKTAVKAHVSVQANPKAHGVLIFASTYLENNSFPVWLHTDHVVSGALMVHLKPSESYMLTRLKLSLRRMNEAFTMKNAKEWETILWFQLVMRGVVCAGNEKYSPSLPIPSPLLSHLLSRNLSLSLSLSLALSPPLCLFLYLTLTLFRFHLHLLPRSRMQDKKHRAGAR
jgi:hypothetical protein